MKAEARQALAGAPGRGSMKASKRKSTSAPTPSKRAEISPCPDCAAPLRRFDDTTVFACTACPRLCSIDTLRTPQSRRGDVLDALMEYAGISGDQYLRFEGAENDRWRKARLAVMNLQRALLSPNPRTDRWLRDAAYDLMSNEDDYKVQLLLDVRAYFAGGCTDLDIFRASWNSIAYGRTSSDALIGDAVLRRALEGLRSEAGVTAAAARLWLASGRDKRRTNEHPDTAITRIAKQFNSAEKRWLVPPLALGEKRKRARR